VTYIPAALRRLVRERAGSACEYCRVPEAAALLPHEVDHVIAQKHGGATEADNLALSCLLCNKHKGSDIASRDPEDRALVPLFHPRRDRWRDHFELTQAEIVPLTPTGRATARLLGLNQPRRAQERALLVAAGLVQVPG
jgi:5-methylcytosine-specific restriction endonuclease McrA